jgi:hypothetical protein
MVIRNVVAVALAALLAACGPIASIGSTPVDKTPGRLVAHELRERPDSAVADATTAFLMLHRKDTHGPRGRQLIPVWLGGRPASMAGAIWLDPSARLVTIDRGHALVASDHEISAYSGLGEKMVISTSDDPIGAVAVDSTGAEVFLVRSSGPQLHWPGGRGELPAVVVAIALTPRYIYASGETGGLWRFDRANLAAAPEQVVHAGEVPAQVSGLERGERLFTAGERVFWEIGGAVVEVTPGAASPVRVVADPKLRVVRALLAPTGIVIATESEELWLLSIDGGTARRIDIVDPSAPKGEPFLVKRYRLLAVAGDQMLVTATQRGSQMLSDDLEPNAFEAQSVPVTFSDVLAVPIGAAP